MTMPKFEPVAKVLVIDEVGRELVFNLQKPLHTADQLTEAYEAGKREATPEGYALVPKQPTLLMLRAMYPCESTTEAYKAMLAAAPERRRMMTLVELLQQAASESDTPNTSIEGKAANLIERQAAQIEMLRNALKFLSYMAQTTGNVMGKDAGLMDGIKAAEQALATPEQALEQFAVRVREQCAKMCEAEYVNVADGDDEVYNSAITHASRGIRAIKELP